MLASKVVKICQFLKQTRTLTDGLILNSKKKFPKAKPVLGVTVNNKSKKRTRKSKIVVKKLSDDIEGIWLDNLNSENLKLYRKTSFGSFRKIDTDKLLDRLKEIYPAKFGNNEISIKLSTEDTNTTVKPVSSVNHHFQPFQNSESNDENERASPYMSDFLVQHMVQFPLLKPRGENSLSEFLEVEKEDFGKVDTAMFPSVTAVLSETMSESCKMKLKQWKDSMIEKLGKEGFNNHQADLLSQGSRFHATLKRYLEIADKRLVNIDPQIEGCWESLKDVLPDISNVRMVEECIYHPILAYRGVVDCVATYRDTFCVIEWKKSNKPKTNLSATYDAPLQLCAYLGALAWNKALNDLDVKNGLVVIAYTDGSPANVFIMDKESCEVYWVHWLQRLQSYWLKKSSTIIQHND